MGLLATDNRQLIYIYSEDSILGKKVLPYVESAQKASRVININRENLTNSIWAEVADMLNMSVGELFSLDQVEASNFGDSGDFTADDWFKILKHNPSLLQNPIIINGNNAELIDSRFNMFKYFEADGANFDKSPEAIKSGEHKDTTGEEKFKILQYDS